MKKITTLLLIFAYLVIISRFVLSASLSVNSSDFTCDAVNGTVFCTIQAAINNASNGDHINVAAGLYNETINVTKRLTLQGSGIGSTLLNCQGSGTGIEIIADESIIENFEIFDCSYGILVLSDSNTLKNNSIHDIVFFGIELNESDNNEIMNNIIYQTDEGIRLGSLSSSNTINFNEFFNKG